MKCYSINILQVESDSWNYFAREFSSRDSKLSDAIEKKDMRKEASNNFINKCMRRRINAVINHFWSLFC